MGSEERPAGLTRDAGFQVGARRTLPLSPDAAWSWLVSPAGAQLWLGELLEGTLAPGGMFRLADGTSGVVRVFAPGSHLRLTWRPPSWPRASTIQLRVVPRGDRAVVAFHQEHMPGPEAREARRAHYLAVLDELERRLAR